MPSVEEISILSENKKTTQDFLARDMEELVSEIKENLRLSGLKPKQTSRTSKCRHSPYTVPTRDWSSCSCDQSRSVTKPCPVHNRLNISNKSENSSSTSDDPYEMLQTLLRDGSLIKEAVRRLQKGLTPKQRYFYDSDEETPKSPLKFCHQLDL
ncbi:unnamed protein product [Bemisia tabaci]|uniref:Uncharacterized protein n=1 Tax=Bemisia tabaci TaxID=7038 RepID=A0A9P0AJ31_BEMTA|nr:unnamed protein product [Bemisia tabaci]